MIKILDEKLVGRCILQKKLGKIQLIPFFCHKCMTFFLEFVRQGIFQILSKGVWSSGMILALGDFNYTNMREALGSIPSSPHSFFKYWCYTESKFLFECLNHCVVVQVGYCFIILPFVFVCFILYI